jgi:hypothetical protein
VDATDNFKVSESALALKQMHKKANRTLNAVVGRIGIPICNNMLIPYERFGAAAGKPVYLEKLGECICWSNTKVRIMYIMLNSIWQPKFLSGAA